MRNFFISLLRLVCDSLENLACIFCFVVRSVRIFLFSSVLNYMFLMYYYLLENGEGKRESIVDGWCVKLQMLMFIV